MISDRRLQYVLMAACNLFLFFLCSTRWNAGYSISAGLVGLVILLLYVKYKKKPILKSKKFVLFYGLFMAGVLIASHLSKDASSIHVSHKFLSYSLPMWLLCFALNETDDILKGTQWGVMTGSWVLNFLVIKELMMKPLGQRIHGFFASANNFAMCLESILPFLWFLTWQMRKRNKSVFLLSLITSAVTTISLLLSKSRGGISGFLIGAVVVLFLIKFQQQSGWSFIKKISAIAVVTIVVASGVFFETIQYQRRSYDSERILLLRSAYAMWQDNKVYGVGFNRWNKVYRSKYILPGAREPKLSLPHNNIANFFSGTGVLGGGGYLLFTFGSLYLLLQHIKKEPDNPFLLMMLWIWIAISVHGMVDNSLYAKFNTRLYFAMWGVMWSSVKAKER